jgi:Tfp pilus assembly protein PilO
MLKPQTKEPGQKTAEVPKIKKPSKIFTEYYSSIILLLITALVGAGYLVIKPKIDEYKAIQANSELIKQNVENEQTYLAALRRSVSAAQSISPDVLTKVDKALPRSFSIPETLVMLNRSAMAANVKITNIAFSPVSDKVVSKTGLQSIQLTLNVSAADYRALKNFLSILEASLRMIDIQMLTVTDFTEAGASFSLQLRTYYYPSADKNL